MADSIVINVTPAVPQRYTLAWLVCLSAGLFFFYEFFQLNIFDVINQSLRDEFHLTAAEISWMSSTYLWADVLFLLPAGLILDRFSARNIIIISMSICVFATFGFALTNSFAFASFFHFLSGIGNAFCFLSCVILVSHWFPPRNQALVIGTLVTMAFVGGMMAHTPFAYLSEYYGWRNALLIDAALGLFLLLWICVFVKDNPCALSTTRKCRPNLRISFLQALTNKQNWLAGCYTSCLNLPIMVLCALWGASYLQIVHHLSAITASNIVSLLFIGSIIGCPLLGFLSDRQGLRKPLIVIGALTTLLIVMPLSLQVSLPPFLLSLLFFFLGFFTSTQVLSYPLIAESNTMDNTGAATAIASVLIMGGGGLGQVLFGLLMARLNFVEAGYTAADFHYAMWLFPLAAIIALFAGLLIRETSCKRVKFKESLEE